MFSQQLDKLKNETKIKTNLRARGPPGVSGALRSLRILRIGRIGSGYSDLLLHIKQRQNGIYCLNTAIQWT